MTAFSPIHLLERLRGIDADLTLLGPDELAGRHPGEHEHNLDAGVLALPGSTEAVATLVSWCADHKVAIVPHGGRTGLVGGGASHAGEIILSTARLNRIESVEATERTAVVQSGVTLQALQDAAERVGLTTGIDLPSRGTATIGGMVSTNAGGILAFRNGVMRHQVLGLEVVLPNGRILRDLTRVVKVSAGPDLKQLFIGAEGALGIVTRVALKLETRRTARATALVGVHSAEAALAVISHFQAQPAVMLEGAELMWEKFIRDSADAFSFDLGWLEAGTAAVLLVEVSAQTVAIATETLETGLEALWDSAALTGGIVAQSLDQSRKFWQLREESSFMYNYHPDCPSFDISVPPRYLDTYVAGLRARLKAIDDDCDAYVFGHIADGNLHISVVQTGELSEEGLLRVEAAIYTGVADAGGSFSAEHGVGTDKRHAYLTYGNPEKRVLARQIKSLLDPDNLFNPGKVPF